MFLQRKRIFLNLAEGTDENKKFPCFWNQPGLWVFLSLISELSCWHLQLFFDLETCKVPPLWFISLTSFQFMASLLSWSWGFQWFLLRSSLSWLLVFPLTDLGCPPSLSRGQAYTRQVIQWTVGVVEPDLLFKNPVSATHCLKWLCIRLSASLCLSFFHLKNGDNNNSDQPHGVVMIKRGLN